MGGGTRWGGIMRRLIAASACATSVTGCWLPNVEQGAPWVASALSANAAIDGIVIEALHGEDVAGPAWSVEVRTATWLGVDRPGYRSHVEARQPGDVVTMLFGTDIVEAGDRLVFFTAGGPADESWILFAYDPEADRAIEPFDGQDTDHYVNCLLAAAGGTAASTRADALIAAAQSFHAPGQDDGGDSDAAWRYLSQQCPRP